MARERSDQNIFFFLITGVERRPHSVRIHRDTFPININTAGIREVAKAKTTSWVTCNVITILKTE